MAKGLRHVLNWIGGRVTGRERLERLEALDAEAAGHARTVNAETDALTAEKIRRARDRGLDIYIDTLRTHHDR